MPSPPITPSSGISPGRTPPIVRRFRRMRHWHARNKSQSENTPCNTDVCHGRRRKRIGFEPIS